MPKPIIKRAVKLTPTANEDERADTMQELDENVVAAEGTDIGRTWEALGVELGFNPLPLNLARFFIIGEVKSGKSTLVSGHKDALVLDYENAHRNIVGASAYRLAVSDYKQHMSVMNQLKSDAMRQSRRFKHIILDTGDRLQELVMDELSREKSTAQKTIDIVDYGQRGKGWSLVSRRLTSFLPYISSLGYGWTVIGHMKWASTENDAGDEIQYQRAALSPGTVGIIKQLADYLMLVKIETIKQQVKEKGSNVSRTEYNHRYVLHTKNQKGRDYNEELGTRIPLPPVMELPLHGGWQTVDSAWQSSVDQLKAEDRRLRR
jgi:hypothetical protein